MKVVYLIPTYNEKENIKDCIYDLITTISKLKKYKHEILIVDDNSPDKTGSIVEKIMLKQKNVHLLTGEKEGLGKAMIRGYLYAIDTLKADIVVTNEADFAFDWKHVPYMLEKIDEGYDVVVGSRHIGVGKTEGWTLQRRVNHWVANYVFATKIAKVKEVYDHNGAFRAIRVKGVLTKVNFKKIDTFGFGFFFYFLFVLTTKTTKFHEFPVTYKFRTRGESKVSFNKKYVKIYFRDIIEYIRLAFKVRAEQNNK